MQYFPTTWDQIMHHKTIISTLLSITLMTSVFSFAQEYREHQDHNERTREHHEDNNDRAYRDSSRMTPDHEHEAAPEHHEHAYNDRNDERRGAGPNHDFYKGKR